MRFALWLAGLFAVAVAVALFAGSNPGTVTLFWPPYRVDLSLNLVLLILVGIFVTLHLALRALSAMFGIPQQARRWRVQQKERAMQATLLDALSHLMGGRFIRARKSAELVVSLEEAVARSGEPLAYAHRLRALAHLLAAESAHSLQDRAVRDAHLEEALAEVAVKDAQDVREAVLLRAARWAFDDRDPARTAQWLDQLPQGASRRTVALRLRFKAARLAGQALQALDLSRLLTKHRAFSEVAGLSIARGLALEHLQSAHDPTQLQRAWSELDPQERALPDVAMLAAERLLDLGGEAELSRQWLMPVWDQMLAQADALQLSQRIRLARLLDAGFAASETAPDTRWLARVEAAQQANPRDAVLQYLAGVVCMRMELWGKAQLLLRQCLGLLKDAGLRRDAWRALALVAEQRDDQAAATEAYRQALQPAGKP